MPPPRKSGAKAEKGSLEDGRRILRLIAKYKAEPDTTRASKLIAAIYPIVISACFSLGGRFSEIARAANESIEEIFTDLDSLAGAGDPIAWIYRRALRVAAMQALRESSSSGSEAAAQYGPGVDISTTGAQLRPEARRGISFLVRAAKARDSALAPTLREALDSLPARLRVALVLKAASPLSLNDIEGIFVETGTPLDPTDQLEDEMARAACLIFEHLGRVAEDG